MPSSRGRADAVGCAREMFEDPSRSPRPTLSAAADEAVATLSDNDLIVLLREECGVNALPLLAAWRNDLAARQDAASRDLCRDYAAVRPLQLSLELLGRRRPSQVYAAFRRNFFAWYRERLARKVQDELRTDLRLRHEDNLRRTAASGRPGR